MYTQEQLQKLKEAYATGALKVRFGDNEIIYKSESEMARTIAKIEQELKPSQKVHQLTPYFTKGLE